MLHIGHDCAAKYELLADNPAFDAALASIEQRRQAAKEVTRRSRVYAHFCSQHEGLAEALEGDHHILSDMKGKLRQYGSLSEKQIAFAFKLYSEVKNPTPKVEEKLVQAPVAPGRQTIRGKVVSKKSYDTAFGSQTKITVKVETPEGNWLCWGTVVECGGCYAQKGDTIEFCATLHAGRESHFALFKRPTKGKVIVSGAVSESNPVINSDDNQTETSNV